MYVLCQVWNTKQRPQVTFMPDLAIFDVPCAFENLDECREVLDDPEFSSLISSLRHMGSPPIITDSLSFSLLRANPQCSISSPV